MGYLKIAAIALLLACYMTPVWAVFNPDDQMLEFTISCYSKGMLYSRSAFDAAPNFVNTVAVGGGTQDAPTYGIWAAWSYGNEIQPNERAAAEIAKFGENIQRITCCSVDFLIHVSEEIDWIEIEMRGCKFGELEPYRSMMQMSPELNEGIINKLFKPVGRVAFAAKQFQPVPWPEELIATE